MPNLTDCCLGCILWGFWAHNLWSIGLECSQLWRCSPFVMSIKIGWAILCWMEVPRFQSGNLHFLLPWGLVQVSVVSPHCKALLGTASRTEVFCNRGVWARADVLEIPWQGVGKRYRRFVSMHPPTSFISSSFSLSFKPFS